MKKSGEVEGAAAARKAECPVDLAKGNPVKALHVFAMLGCCAEVEALLDAGVDVDAPDPSGFTALARVAGGKDFYFMEALESMDMWEAVAPEAREWYEDSVLPMQYHLRDAGFAHRMRLPMVRLLVARGADLEAKGYEGRTPLCMAVFKHDLEMVRLLLELGASPDAAGDDGMTPLILSGVGHTPEILDALLAAGADRSLVTNHGIGLAAVAAMKDRTDILQEEFAAGRASADTRDAWGRTLLFIATACCSVNAVRWLIEAGAEVDARDKNGTTPLMLTSASGQDHVFEVVRLLLEAGADPAAEDARHVSVLFHATGFGAELPRNPLAERPVLTAALACAPIPLSDRMYKCIFPQVLVFAVIYGTPETVRTIVQRAKLRKNDKYVRMAFHGAILWGKLDMVRLFVELFGKDIITPRRRSSDVPAVFALLDSPSPDPEVLRYLLEQGADVVKARRHGKSPLCVAAANGHAEIVRMLVAAGARVDKDAILHAARSSNPDLVLAVFGDDVDHVRENANTLYTVGEAEPLDIADEWTFNDWDDDDWLQDYIGKADDDWDGDDWGDDDDVGNEFPPTWLNWLIPSGGSKERPSYVEYLRWLTSIRPPSPEERLVALCKSAEKADVESVRYLLEDAAELEEPTPGELMRHAAQGGSVEIIRQFAQRGFPIDKAPKKAKDETPLWHAVYRRHTEAVRELLSLGADPRRDSFRPPLLELALDRHNYWALGMATLLLDAGAPANPTKLHQLLEEIPFPKPLADLFLSRNIPVVSQKRKKPRKK